MNVVCVSFRSNEKGKLKGFADLVVEPVGIRLYSCELFRSESSEWVAFPSRPYESRDGETKYARMVDFTTVEAYEAFKVSAIEAIRQFRAEHPPSRENVPINAGTGANS